MKFNEDALSVLLGLPHFLFYTSTRPWQTCIQLVTNPEFIPLHAFGTGDLRSLRRRCRTTASTYVDGFSRGRESHLSQRDAAMANIKCEREREKESMLMLVALCHVPTNLREPLCV